MSQKAMLFLVIGSALALGALSGNPEKTGHDASIPSLVSSLASFNRTLGRRFGVSWNNDTLSLTVSDLNASNAFNGPKTLWSSVPGSGFAAASSGSWDAQERDGSFRVHSEVTGKTTVQTLDTVDFTPGTAGTGAALTLAGQLLLPSNEGVALLPDVSSGGIANYTFAFSSDPQLDGHLKFELSVVGLATTTELNQLFLRYEMEPDEAVYGFGHQYSFANLRGKVVPVMTTEQGIGRGLEPITAILNTFGGGSGGNWHTTYSAIPQYLTSEMRSVFLENSEVAYFDSTANNSGEWQVIKPVANSSCWQQPSFSGKDSNRDDSSQMLRLCGRILAGNNPLDLIEQYTLWAGRMQQLPAWTQNGAVVGFEGGTAAVRNVWAQLKAANVPLAGFWLQDWSGRRDDAGDERLWWNWELDEDYYPGWDALVLEMREAGARMLTYINPYLSNDVGSKKPNFRRDLWAEANASGFLIRNSSGQAYLQSSGITSAFSFGTIDLTQAAARTWTKEIIKCNMLRVGPGCGLDGATTTGLSNVSASGWMCDFGEYVAFDAVLGETGAELSPAQAHNLFPQLWAQTVREAVNEVQQTNHQAAPRGTANDVVFFSRSSAGQSPSFSPLFWMGDQLTTFDGYDGLRSAIVGMMTGGISGHALSHSDIGLFTRIARKLFAEIMICDTRPWCACSCRWIHNGR
eukprot:INCI15722.1.p1 GENE.INCI15722.1~~INCI15722.1.p1  ORF type:complete len:697 (-),score=100.57 INCI15722.1:2473-4533(-)